MDHTYIKKKGGCDGFSIIDLIMTIVIVGILSAVIAPILYQGFESFIWSRDITNTNARAQLAIERMSREIRGIQPSDIIEYTAPNYLDTNKLKFSLNGSPVEFLKSAQNQLLRNSDLLADNVTSLTFTYYKDDWATQATRASEVWGIRITIVLTGQQVAETVQTSVFLRSGSRDR
jgi:type II secretory pathway pseudopilin PulG